MSIVLGGIPIIEPSALAMRLAMLIWGDAGCGKTTLAATAPGTKLFIMFDPDGVLSLSDRADVVVMDMSASNPRTIMAAFRTEDPFTLSRYLSEHPEIETVVVDSVTTLAYMALQEAVASNTRSTMEQPGMHGYTWRNASVLRVCSILTKITKKLDRNIIFITHENAPERDAEGRVVSITMALSENTANQVGIFLNEVWWMRDLDGKRSIAVRPCRQRKPMKTRLFTGDAKEFDWHYNPNTLVGEGIADWFHSWQANGGKQIPLPAVAKATTSRGGVKK